MTTEAEMIPGVRVRTVLSSDAPEALFLGDRTGVILSNDMEVNGAVLGDPVIGFDSGDVWVQVDSTERDGATGSDIYAFRFTELALIEETTDDDRG